MIELSPIHEARFSYDAAFIYCITCTHDNKYDWRFPTVDDDTELGCIEYARPEGCIWYGDEFKIWSKFPWETWRLILVRDKDD
jgi:hypothetical protein